MIHSLGERSNTQNLRAICRLYPLCITKSGDRVSPISPGVCLHLDPRVRVAAKTLREGNRLLLCAAAVVIMHFLLPSPKSKPQKRSNPRPPPNYFYHDECATIWRRARGRDTPHMTSPPNGHHLRNPLSSNTFRS